MNPVARGLQRLASKEGVQAHRFAPRRRGDVEDRELDGPARTSLTSTASTEAGSTAAANSASPIRAKASDKVAASTASSTSGRAQIAVA